jgi:hypothetical protein
MSGSSPPKKRARSEEVQDGTVVNDLRVEKVYVYVATHCHVNCYDEIRVDTLGVFESLEKAERRIVEDKIDTVMYGGDDDELEQKYSKEFTDDSDSESSRSWPDCLDQEAIARDLDELVEKFFGPGDKHGNHTWAIRKKKIVYADSDFVAGFVKSAHKT